MNPIPKRNIHYEAVPVAAQASFTFREFRWPRFPFNWHYHPELELSLIVQGRGLRFVGDSVGEFHEGDLCLVGTNVPHSWASPPQAPPGIRSLVIQFSPETWGASFWNLPELQVVRDLFARSSRGLHFEGPTQSEVAGLIHEMLGQHAGSWQRINSLLFMLGLLAESKHGHPLCSVGYDPDTHSRPCTLR